MQGFSLCSYCQRFQPDPLRPTCEAFPNGIPDEILQGEHDHRQPFEGEEILFLPRADAPADDVLDEMYA